jgi:preprotein translocase subunit SecA
MQLRTMLPSYPGDPHYVFVISTPNCRPQPDSDEWERYRSSRREILLGYSEVALEHSPEASMVVVEHRSRKTGRNAPCPCGSGKKYKRCHGI